jgi:DNA polymerase-3 subunit delta'
MKYDLFLANQPKVLKLINNSFKKNRLVHTYLFEGPRGTSKLEAAYYFAQKLLCSSKTNTPCMKCENCQKVMNEVHPSVFYIEPVNDLITKDMVEKLEREFALTPIGDGKRIYIIKDIDKANASAANSLLKFLEELEGDKYGILLTENLHSVIPTIRSRSVIVFFDMLPANVVANELINKGVDAEVSYILSTLTNSVSDSLNLINEGQILDLIELVKKLSLSDVLVGKPPILILQESEDVLVKVKDKKYHNIFLDLLITLAHDKLYYILNQLDRIVFKDTMGVIGTNLNCTYEQVVAEIELLLKFKERLKYNVNIELFYTQLVIEMMR